MQNRACNRGATQPPRRVTIRSTGTGKLFTGLRPTDSVRSSQAGHRGLAAWSGSAVMSALTSVSSSQPVRADTTTGCIGPEQTEYRLRFSRIFCACRRRLNTLPYPIHGRAPFCRPASPQTAPADVPAVMCRQKYYPQTGHGLSV